MEQSKGEIMNEEFTTFTTDLGIADRRLDDISEVVFYKSKVYGCPEEFRVVMKNSSRHCVSRHTYSKIRELLNIQSVD